MSGTRNIPCLPWAAARSRALRYISVLPDPVTPCSSTTPPPESMAASTALRASAWAGVRLTLSPRPRPPRPLPIPYRLPSGTELPAPLGGVTYSLTMRPSRSAALTVEGEQEASRASSAGAAAAVASALIASARRRPGSAQSSPGRRRPSVYRQPSPPG